MIHTDVSPAWCILKHVLVKKLIIRKGDIQGDSLLQKYFGSIYFFIAARLPKLSGLFE